MDTAELEATDEKAEERRTPTPSDNPPITHITTLERCRQTTTPVITTPPLTTPPPPPITPTATYEFTSSPPPPPSTTRTLRARPPPPPPPPPAPAKTPRKRRRASKPAPGSSPPQAKRANTQRQQPRWHLNGRLGPFEDGTVTAQHPHGIFHAVPVRPPRSRSRSRSRMWTEGEEENDDDEDDDDDEEGRFSPRLLPPLPPAWPRPFKPSRPDPSLPLKPKEAGTLTPEGALLIESLESRGRGGLTRRLTLPRTGSRWAADNDDDHAATTMRQVRHLWFAVTLPGALRGLALGREGVGGGYATEEAGAWLWAREVRGAYWVRKVPVAPSATGGGGEGGAGDTSQSIEIPYISSPSADFLRPLRELRTLGIDPRGLRSLTLELVGAAHILRDAEPPSLDPPLAPAPPPTLQFCRLCLREKQRRLDRARAMPAGIEAAALRQAIAEEVEVQVEVQVEVGGPSPARANAARNRNRTRVVLRELPSQAREWDRGLERRRGETVIAADEVSCLHAIEGEVGGIEEVDYTEPRPVKEEDDDDIKMEDTDAAAVVVVEMPTPASVAVQEESSTSADTPPSAPAPSKPQRGRRGGRRGGRAGRGRGRAAKGSATATTQEATPSLTQTEQETQGIGINDNTNVAAESITAAEHAPDTPLRQRFLAWVAAYLRDTEMPVERFVVVGQGVDDQVAQEICAAARLRSGTRSPSPSG